MIVESIDGLFGGAVLLAEASAEMWDDQLGLFAEERQAIARAVEKRRREFTAGRLCARSLLAEMGHPASALLVGDQGAPLWPADIVGSITHCADRCFVALAERSRFVGVGIDVEPASPLSEALLQMVCTPRELEMGRSWAGVDENWSKIIFSAKESYYKCYFPIARHVLDFLDVEVQLDPAQRTFIATLRHAALPAAAGRRECVGRYRRLGSHLLTASSAQAV